ncbi:MAG: NUDIX hydrolase [Bacteroidales bacterium]|nr:NUDIX hydrolase [Bacteroidales bacterium]
MDKYCYKYPHPALTADNIVFAYDGQNLNVLLIERKADPFKNCWAFAGGFMNIDETIEQCASRELAEETGLKVEKSEQLACFSSVNRDPRERVVSIAFICFAKMQTVTAGDDAQRACWFKLNAVPELAFDHRQMLNMALQRLKEKILIDKAFFDFLKDDFTDGQITHLKREITDYGCK